MKTQGFACTDITSVTCTSRIRFYGLVFGPGGEEEREYVVPLHPGSEERELGSSSCCPNPGSPCKCKQSPKREDQHLFRHICMPRWEIHLPLHSIVSSSLLGLG